jgi:uncharacterized protein YndB with AHSA1/START domain
VNPTKLSDDQIVQEVVIQARAQHIFRALTRPEELLKWWSAPEKFKLLHTECDLRPGGQWQMKVAGTGGNPTSSVTVSGQYQTIDPPHLLIYTWNRENEGTPETLVRWELIENDGSTTVRVTHSGLITDALRLRNGGWALIVVLLKAYVDHQESTDVQATSKNIFQGDLNG